MTTGEGQDPTTAETMERVRQVPVGGVVRLEPNQHFGDVEVVEPEPQPEPLTGQMTGVLEQLESAQRKVQGLVSTVMETLPPLAQPPTVDENKKSPLVPDQPAGLSAQVMTAHGRLERLLLDLDILQQKTDDLSGRVGRL